MHAVPCEQSLRSKISHIWHTRNSTGVSTCHVPLSSLTVRVDKAQRWIIVHKHRNTLTGKRGQTRRENQATCSIRRWVQMFNRPVTSWFNASLLLGYLWSNGQWQRQWWAETALVLNEATSHEEIRERGGMVPRFPNIGSRWSCQFRLLPPPHLTVSSTTGG